MAAGDAGFQVRVAAMADAPEIARLCTQLGYPVTPEQMTSRLGVVITAGDRQVFVVAYGAKLLGWIGIELRTTLETGRKAEIVGLVVDAGLRRGGVGKTLIRAAEDWVRGHGLDALMVRSNITRIESHPFYEGMGFNRTKTQHVYFKVLD